MKSRIVQIRQISAGETVGYGRVFVAQRNSKIAVVPIGYADGVPRALSGKKINVLINGYAAPIIGRICMDQLTVDATDIPDVQATDVVTLIGCERTICITAEEWAKQTGSLTNEVLSRVSLR